jgi:molecular chaperone DnaK
MESDDINKIKESSEELQKVLQEVGSVIYSETSKKSQDDNNEKDKDDSKSKDDSIDADYEIKEEK